MTSAFQSIGNSLGGIAGGVAAGLTAGGGGGTGGGGKFSFDPAELEALAKDWLELAYGYRDSRTTAERLRIEGPGREDASDGQAEAAMQSWIAYGTSLDQKYDYSMAQAMKCAGALAAYHNTDQESVLRMLSGAGAESTPGGI